METDALVNGVLSFFIPGLGQAVSGDIKKGVIFFVIAVIMGIIALFIFQSWVVNIINLAIAVYAAYDAYQMNA